MSQLCSNLLFGREAVNMETGAFKIEDFTGGYDPILGKKNPPLYVIHLKTSYLFKPP